LSENRIRSYSYRRYAPKEIYLRGRNVFDLSRLREAPVKGPKEADLDTEIEHYEDQGEAMPGETGVFRADVDNVDVREMEVRRADKKEGAKPQEKVQKKLPHELPESERPPKNLKEPITLTIVHTNDLHGNLLPREDFPDYQNTSKKIKVGGEAVISTIINREREQAKARGENFLLVDSGDMAMGTPISGIFEGKPMMDIMNIQGYDAAAIGNHDFDWGIDALQNMIQDATFPFLAANIKDEHGKPLPNVQPFMIKEMPGLKVGLVGVITPETDEITGNDEVRNLDFQDPVESLKATIPQMKRQGADMIVVLSHSGLDEDKRIAKEVKGIDLIVGGHSHHILDEPVRVGSTMIVQTGFGGKNVGKVQLQWNPGKKSVVKAEGHLIPVDGEKINPDMEISSLISKYKQKMDSMMSVPLARSGEDMIQPNEGQESNLGNLVTDMMRKETGAQIALLNSGSIRTNLMKGIVRYEDIYSVLPFSSKIVTLNMKGKDILEALEQSAGQNRDKVLQLSGLNVVYDSSKPEGQRLQRVSLEDGEKLDPVREYSVATIDFLVKGGDHYTSFKSGKEVDTEGPVLTEAVARQVRSMGVLTASLTGRVQNLA